MKKLLTFIFITSINVAQATPLANDSITKVLNQVTTCSSTIVIRSEGIATALLKDACQALSLQEEHFHKIFETQGKPVKHDNNKALQVNVYQSKKSYVDNATNHFDIETNNGGMYLEGLPDSPGNQANFITYIKNGVIWNLRHEYVHYLDGRFNLYGDFCASLHDSHSPPENCPQPAPLLPHTVWWSEGVAEYIAKFHNHPRAFKAVSHDVNKYSLSQLFDTSYETNGGTERIYSWGYFAARYMIEEQRDKTEQMLEFLRSGDLPRYQSLVRSWEKSMDKDFNHWLSELVSKTDNSEQ